LANDDRTQWGTLIVQHAQHHIVVRDPLYALYATFHSLGRRLAEALGLCRDDEDFPAD